jgi:predicted PurR-regulated permease PerM
MHRARMVEFAFFFGALGIVGFIVWQILAPFITALALAAIIVVICYPLNDFFLRYLTRRNRSLAALLSTFVVLLVIVTPITLISMLLVNEFITFYHTLDVGTQLPIDVQLSSIEDQLQAYIPGFDINLSEQIKESVSWFTHNLGSIFAGTVSVILTFLIALLGSFYLFRDGKRLIEWLISISPLDDDEDRVIFDRVARSVRSVATGTVLLAIIQGLASGIGFSIFGINQAILWGSVAALGALLPGIGTSGVMIPAIGYLFYIGATGNAVGLLVWALVAIVVVDNIIGPYLMGRGNNLHPFIVLVSVLGGVSLFGPIGFILGPVCMTLFMVLLELYGVYMNNDPADDPKPKRK